MNLVAWSWAYLSIYIGLMLILGLIARSRVKTADDYAVARAAYSPLVLALAYAASTASGATFLGSTALSYEFGLSTVWGNFLYPLGV
jgi:sodium/proline symporter